MNNPFEYVPDKACDEAFRQLTARIEALKQSGATGDAGFIRELEAGKMLGVLIATDDAGLRHTLYAFSGQLGDRGFLYPGFVGPVFDYLQPDGHFKTHERDISRQNLDISRFEEDYLPWIRSDYEQAKTVCDAEVSAFKEKCRRSKAARDEGRKQGFLDEEEMVAMTRQSQYEKAELHRLKKRMADAIEPLATALKDAETRLAGMKEKRRSDSEALQTWLFTNFRLLNARGESRSLSEIFAETPLKIPPSGAGECCAPKLLQAAYLHGWHPESIAEYWYGKGKDGEVRIHGEHYPACRGKCLPVLGWMLRGLRVEPSLDSNIRKSAMRNPEIIYENEWFCIVDKPEGMLSVPGKGAAQSVQRWLEQRYGADRQVRVAHRLDQDTSGILLATFGEAPYKLMQSLFATRKVRKTYEAVLEGDYEARGMARTGHIDLPLSPDWLDRPRQRVDREGGKEALTDYEFTGVADGHSRILFHPLTGRTHQLRVHAASAMGLGMPIAGDRLYGLNKGNGHGRLHLHARTLEFTFPIDGKHYRFDSPPTF